MNNRTRAINKIASLKPSTNCKAENFELDFYAEDVFSVSEMKKYLPKDTAKKLLSTLNEGNAIDATIAADVAHAMKRWALSRGATHFTHWFQPLTGSTAEKHDSFLEPSAIGEAIMTFSGKNLIVGEPDASSFPSGGLRCTFEARGYTAWDPTSPAFIKRHENGATLCIPTVFCSYTGEALDKKTPLLRSIQALKKATNRIMKCLNVAENIPTITLGAEQEYFLIDKNFYLARPDLIQTGRTIFGSTPAKHQQLEDHYFGSIKPRILNFMNEVEKELWKLGIPAKTRHNEVAPAQFEIAPMFEELNLAVDHNMLIMEILRQTAERHGLVCLLHEKPFAGINGSGKHNNWSVAYGNQNLLEPGANPHQNAVFLTILTTIIRAVHIHSDLLRSATASAGNDHRLGANEAPPAIVSMFLGDQLSDVIEQIQHGSATSSKKATKMRIGADTIPALPKDTTDRNRTSPFAFTGNKFEFRAPGSSQSCAGINVVLNTIVTESMDYMAEKIEKFDAKSFNEQLEKLLHDEITEHKNIIFNGDNYSANWVVEAEKRGLPNLRTTTEALKPLLDEKNINLFKKYGVFNDIEMNSRYEVFVEDYHRKIKIEGEIALDMAKSIFYPVALESFNSVATALSKAKDLNITNGTSALTSSVEAYGTILDNLSESINQLEKALRLEHQNIITEIAALRKVVDKLETMVDDAKWPLPKYREMLFVY